MTRELVLLSEIAVTEDLLLEVARDVLTDGTGISYRDGEIVQFVTAEGRPTVTVFDSRPVHEPSEAAAALIDPPTTFGLWTEITIPRGADPVGASLVAAIASRVGGVVKEKR